jgi:hypothetical protein
VRDFASPYRKVPYFGIWAEETAHQYNKRDAMAELADAAGCCFDDDVRQRPELRRALEYLARETSRAVYGTVSGKPSTSRTRCSGSKGPMTPGAPWPGASDGKVSC